MKFITAIVVFAAIVAVATATGGLGYAWNYPTMGYGSYYGLGFGNRYLSPLSSYGYGYSPLAYGYGYSPFGYGYRSYSSPLIRSYAAAPIVHNYGIPTTAYSTVPAAYKTYGWASPSYSLFGGLGGYGYYGYKK
ncbi:hypothetical protein DERF_006136 [Dermatophagoides farinae]|uniref:Shematrin-like protein 1 n=1 Tax=Dermatophagoides farinae TaxID=6954 RepID=A0A922I6X3_DERFA|nr:hypothetical protein DERF_006136 [Dermatophagoides farinae]